MNNYTTLTRYKAATPRSARRQKGYTVPTISLPSGNSVSLGGVVMLSGEQTITSIKDYLAGIKIGGLLVYSSKPDTIFIDANLVVRGAVTMYGDNGTTAPSIWDAFPYDDETIKRNAAGKFYAVGGGSSSTGGLDYEMLDDYLTINGYLTGITGKMVTNALGYTPLDKQGVAFDSNKFGGLSVADFARVKQEVSDFDANNMPDGVWGGKLFGSPNWALNYYAYLSVGSGNYKMQFNGVGNRLTYRAGNESGIENKDWVEILSSANYSNYALPITGGTVSGNLLVTGATTCRDNFRTNDNYYGFSVKSQGSEDNWYGVKTYMQFDEGATMGVCRIGTAFRYQGLVIGFSTGNDYNYNIPNEYNYTDVFLFGKNGDFLANGALRLGQNNRTRIIENPFAAYGMVLADSNNNPLVTVSYFSDHAYVYNYKNSKENSGIAFYDDGRVVVAQNLIATGTITMFYSSDKRLKQNIRKVDASKTLMSLGGVYQYEYIDSEVAKNSTYGGSHYGLIYQNVKGSALDKMCFEREDGMGALNYVDTDFISIIAGATMENISEVEKLKRKIRTLENKVKQLERVA